MPLREKELTDGEQGILKTKAMTETLSLSFTSLTPLLRHLQAGRLLDLYHLMSRLLAGCPGPW